MEKQREKNMLKINIMCTYWNNDVVNKLLCGK